MKFATRIHNCPRTPRDIYEPSLVLPFLRGLVEQAFRLGDFGGEETFGPWWDMLYNPSAPSLQALSDAQKQALFTPGISPALAGSVGDFLARQRQELVIQAFAVARGGDMKGFEFLFTLSGMTAGEDGGEAADVCYATATDKDVNNAERKAFWQQLPFLMYRVWRPIFTYLTTFEDQPTTSPEDARAFRFQYVYDCNIYAPEVVAHFGREKLLTAPDATVQVLADGGIALLPTRREAVAAHLGLLPAPA